METKSPFGRLALSRRKAIFLSLLMWCCLGIIGSASAQQLIYFEPFNSDPINNANPNLNDWQTESLAPASPGAVWEFAREGTAVTGAYWDDRIDSPSTPRQRIRSTTRGGALVFNSDFLDSDGIRGAACDPANGTCAPHAGVVISPSIRIDTVNLGANETFGLIFNQYFRGYEGTKTFVDISRDGGGTWDSIEVNTEITSRRFGGETAPNSRVVVNITDFVINSAGARADTFRFRFRFTGSYYFWLIDDVKIETIRQADLEMSEIVYPRLNSRCYLSDREIVKVRLTNLGDTARTYTIKAESIAFTQTGQRRLIDSVEQFFEVVFAPNETREFALTEPLDMKTNDSTTVDELVVSVTLDGDANQDNDTIRLGDLRCDICTDSLGAEFVCNQAIIRFNPAVPARIKDSVRALYDAVAIDLCDCDTLELWNAPIPLEVRGDTLIGAEGGVENCFAEVDIEEGGQNYIVEIDPSIEADQRRITYNSPDPVNNKPVKLAIIDTGLDFEHIALNGDLLWNNVGELADPLAVDQDGNCISQDNLGYNVLEPTRIPDDDGVTGHGTHVSGIAMNGLTPDIGLQVITIKSLDQNGRGGLFELLCGMEYAGKKEAQVLNLSLGYTGVEAPILGRAIERLNAADVLVITSAGNDMKSNDDPDMPHWPSNYNTTLKNVVAVTSLFDSARAGNTYQLDPGANFGPGQVDVGALGVNVLSMLPNDEFGLKTGTSMAAAAVSRFAAIYRANQPFCSASSAKAFILTEGDQQGMTNIAFDQLTSSITNSRIIVSDPTVFPTQCLIPVGIGARPPVTNWVSFPNPFQEEVVLQLELTQATQLTLQVFDGWGRMVHQGSKLVGAGTQEMIWRPGNMPTGMYIYRLIGGKQPIATGKWIYQ